MWYTVIRLAGKHHTVWCTEEQESIWNYIYKLEITQSFKLTSKETAVYKAACLAMIYSLLVPGSA